MSDERGFLYFGCKKASRNFRNNHNVVSFGFKKAFRNFRTNHSVGDTLRQPNELY